MGRNQQHGAVTEVERPRREQAVIRGGLRLSKLRGGVLALGGQILGFSSSDMLGSFHFRAGFR